MKDVPGRVAQSVTCLATDASLTAYSGVASLIPARSHTFVEIDHEIFSTVILLPSAESFKKGCCQLQAKVSPESPYHLAAVSGAHFTQGTILIVILVSSGSAKSRTHQSAVGGFLVTRRGWPGRLRAYRIWTFINSV